MNLCDNISPVVDNIVSFLLGILISLLFYFTFKPKYIVIKNKNNQITK